MLTQGKDVEAHALRQRGWSISAIARHLDYDRKTVRGYLSGHHQPGKRHSSAADLLAGVEYYIPPSLEGLDLPDCLLVLRLRLGADLGHSGTREFIKVLRLLERATVRELTGAVTEALRIGATARTRNLSGEPGEAHVCGPGVSVVNQQQDMAARVQYSQVVRPSGAPHGSKGSFRCSSPRPC
jgi:hypothetical protein